jgi:hypothetical protein
MGKLDAGQRNCRTPERLEASHRSASALADAGNMESHGTNTAQPADFCRTA